MRNKLRLTRSLALLAFIVLIMMPGRGWGQTLFDSYSDGNFTASPVWGGNTTLWTIVANSDAAAGATGSNTLRLNSSGGSTDYLSSQVSSWGDIQEWGFWVGRRAQAYTAANQQYFWLYANEATLNNATVDGYRLAIGDDAGDDNIRLEYIVNGALSATVITSSGAIANGLTDIGFLVRVTRSATGVWTLYTSTLPTANGTGAIATDTPNSSNATVSQGSATHNTIVPAVNGYIGVAALHSIGASALAANEIDQVYFTATSAATTITSTVGGGAWATGGTWVGGNAPAPTDNVVIAGPVTTGAVTRNAGTTTTINVGASLAVSGGTYTDNGATTVNGTFEIGTGGWATGTNLAYGAAGTLTMNAAAYGVNNGTYWPASNGPVNVNILQSVTMGFARSVTGTLSVSADVTNATTNTLTVSGGTCQINNTSATFSDPLLYSGTSNLVYNVTGTIGRGNEWNNSPSNVTLQATTTLNYPNGWGAITRTLTGNLTIGTGTALYMDYGSPGTGVGALTVGGNVSLSGNLSLGNQAGGDLNVAGNWSNTGGTFTPNGRAVTFNGTGAQSITNALGATFAYLIINKASGTLTLANNVTVNASSSDVLQLLNAGSFDLNGKSLTLSGAGGNILVTGAARTISSGVAGATINISGAKTVTSATSGSLVIGTNITTVLTAGLNCGASLTTVNGTLQINAGGFITTNAPTYGSASTLLYNSGTTYGRGAEWNATTPANIQLSSNTALNYPNGATTTAKSLTGNLTIDAGSALYMDYGTSGYTTGALSVGGNLVMNGNLSLSDAIGGDLNVAGNWTKGAGTFNPNSRLVTFTGATPTLTGATTFDYLTLNNSTGLTLQTSSAVTVTQTLILTSGKLTLGANDLTIGSSGSISGQTSAKYIVTNSTGKLKRTVGASAVIFPVGNSAYNPITFNNSGTSDVYGVLVADGALTTGANNTKTVSRRWVTTEAVAGGSNLSVVAQYNTGEPNTGFAAATDPFIGFYNGSTWTQAAATAAGANPFTYTSNANLSPSDMTTGTQYFALGKDNAFLSVATKLVITSVSPTSPTAGSGFSVTVQSQDAYGLVNVVAGTAFTLTTNGNAGVIGGTVTGTILASTSSITVSGVTLASAGTLVTLTATRTSGDVLTAGTSSTFTVLAAADHLAFVGVPATGNVGVNLTSFTVEARRPDNSVDNTYAAANIVISKATGSGNLSGTLSVPATLGVATFSATQFDAASTYTLSANSGSLTAATSGSIVISLVPVTLATWNFGTISPGSASPAGVPANITISDITQGNSYGVTTMLSTTSPSGNTGASGLYNAGIAANTGDLATGSSGSAYFEFTITPTSGKAVKLTGISFGTRSTATGPQSYTLRSNSDSYASDISIGTISNTSTWAAKSNTGLAVSSAPAIIFRLYGYNGAGSAGSGSVNWRIDDLNLTGNVLNAPTVYAMTGGGAYCAGGSGVAVGLAGSQAGVNYQLYIGGTTPVGTLVTGTGSVLSFGTQTAGNYTVTGTADGSDANMAGTTTMSGSAVITVEATPVAGILAKTPNTSSVLTGTNVSASLTAGSGGNGTDELEYRFDGAGSWAAYTTGSNLSTTGQTSVEIRTRRTATVCSSSVYTTVSWTVDATTTYTGTGNWSASGNWSHGIPAAGIDAIVNGDVTVDVAAETNNLTINTGKSVTISSTKSLTVSGTLTNTNNAGLVIKSDATGTGSLITSSSPNATVERYITQYAASGGENMYHFISSPVASQKIQDVMDGIVVTDENFLTAPLTNGQAFYSFDEANNMWINTKADDAGNWNSSFESNFGIGKGYMVAYPADVTKNFTGALNTYPAGSPLALTCTYTPEKGKGWNLLGNPFASSIDWGYITDNGLGGGMDNALYYYDNGTSNYKYYIKLDGETSASVSGGLPFIPAMQGFMVHAKSSGTKTVTISNAARTHSGQNVFYKSTNSVPGSLSLKVSANGYEDEAFIHFNQNATTAFDGKYDAFKLKSYSTNVPSIYTVASDGNQLAINGLPEVEENSQIPVYFVAGKDGQYTLTANLQNLPEAHVYLVDNKLSKTQNLSDNPVYTFAASTTDQPNRFKLTFNSVGINEPAGAEPLRVYIDGTNLNVTGVANANAEIRVTNMIGQVVLRSNTGGNTQTILNANKLQNGVYVVSLISGSKVVSAKIVVSR